MNILTFDIEEWFHLLESESTGIMEQWDAFPSRIHENMDRIFDILSCHQNRKATFFIIGWIAKRYPEIVKQISDAGYGIGFHTCGHQLIHKMTPKELREDMRKGLGELENITGRKVEVFRAPGFSLTEKCNWAFEILAETGIKYDSSIFPTRHAHGGYPSFPHTGPALIKTASGDIMEFPIGTVRFAGKRFMYSGGGYFRLLPYSLIRYISKKEPYIMTYLHPRDMDAGQPVLKGLPLARRFKSYVGLKTCASKFEKWIGDFEWMDIEQAANRIDWDKAPGVNL